MAQPNSKQAKGRQPITRHPLFPVVVALWFAALLAIGSLALSTALLENLVLAARIDSILPAAAPPLGATARLVLALTFGMLGAAIGWILAKHVTAPKDETAPHVFNVADVDLDMPVRWPGIAELPQRAVSVAAAPVAVEPMPAPTLDPASLVEEAGTEAEASPPAIALAPVPEVVVQEVIPVERPAQPPRTAAQRIAAAELAELSHVELVERLAIALQHREELRGSEPEPGWDRSAPVLNFPDFVDRRNARSPLPVAQSRPAPQETEKALREALAQLQRMSGGG